jgi:hypothetical protein
MTSVIRSCGILQLRIVTHRAVAGVNGTIDRLQCLILLLLIPQLSRAVRHDKSFLDPALPSTGRAQRTKINHYVLIMYENLSQTGLT